MTNIKHYLLTVLVALVSSISANAYDFEVDGIYYNVLSKDELTCEVTRKSSSDYSYSGDFVIPASVVYGGKTITVSKIGHDAFFACIGLTSVTIPNSVTAIDNHAFDNCRGLTSITIPNSVTAIGDCAFSGCIGLSSVIIPNCVTTIEPYTFQNCSGLTSITIPNSMTTIGDCVFYGCSNLTSITIPNSVTNIESNAFGGCSGIKEITSLNVAPPKTYSNAFEGISKIDCVVKVPAEALVAYQSADGWSEFWNIVAMPSDCGANTIYEGSANEITESGDLAAAKNMIENSTAPNALVFSTTNVESVADIPHSNIAALNEDGEYVANEIVLTDAQPFYCPMDVPAEHITYARSFKNTDWQALYIPFDMSYDDWKDKAEVAYINNVHQWDDDNDGVIDRTVLEFITKKSGSIEANKPYVIRPKQAGEVAFTSENAILHATPEADGYVDCRSTTTEYTLCGTYQEKADMYANGYYAMVDGNFKQAESSGVALSPFRTYLKIESRTGAGTVQQAKRIGIMVDGIMDDNVTGMLDIWQATSDEGENIYNLSGQKVNRGYKGIAIKNGKKYIAK